MHFCATAVTQLFRKRSVAIRCDYCVKLRAKISDGMTACWCAWELAASAIGAKIEEDKKGARVPRDCMGLKKKNLHTN